MFLNRWVGWGFTGNEWIEVYLRVEMDTWGGGRIFGDTFGSLTIVSHFWASVLEGRRRRYIPWSHVGPAWCLENNDTCTLNHANSQARM